MSDIDNGSNGQKTLAKQPDFIELLKATAASKAELKKETARLEQEVAALRALPQSGIISRAISERLS